jgi:hypothetical protein
MLSPHFWHSDRRFHEWMGMEMSPDRAVINLQKDADTESRWTADQMLLEDA